MCEKSPSLSQLCLFLRFTLRLLSLCHLPQLAPAGNLPTRPGKHSHWPVLGFCVLLETVTFNREAEHALTGRVGNTHSNEHHAPSICVVQNSSGELSGELSMNKVGRVQKRGQGPEHLDYLEFFRGLWLEPFQSRLPLASRALAVWAPGNLLTHF